jgi:hypothetical protein
VATYRVLYWQDIPSQIRAEDAADDVSLPLSDRFQAQIDALAAARGLQGADDYLAQWHWSEDQDRDGTADEVAQAIRAELEAAADF